MMKIHYKFANQPTIQSEGEVEGAEGGEGEEGAMTVYWRGPT